MDRRITEDELDVSVNDIPDTMYPAFIRSLLECMGASEIVEPPGQIGINYYAMFNRSSVLGFNTNLCAGVIYAEAAGVEGCFRTAIAQIGNDPSERFFRQSRGRNPVTMKCRPDQYELIAVDRSWKANALPPWFSNLAASTPYHCTFIGHRELTDIALRNETSLKRFFSTLAKRRERDIAALKQIQAEQQAKINEKRRDDARYRWLLEDKERLQRKAAWENISLSISHDFGNVLVSFDYVAGLFHALTDGLKKRIESDFRIPIIAERSDSFKSIPEPPYPDDDLNAFVNKTFACYYFAMSNMREASLLGREKVLGLKDYKRASVGVRLVEGKVASVSEVIQRAATLLGVSLTPRIEVSCEEFVLRMDLKKLEQVFSELIANAKVLFRPRREGQRLRISTNISILDNTHRVPEQYQVIVDRLGGKAVLISLDDNGMGIEDSKKPMVFVPGYTERPADAAPGSGQGLAGCEEIISSHEGRIIEDGEYERGASFKIFLPLTQEGPTND